MMSRSICWPLLIAALVLAGAIAPAAAQGRERGPDPLPAVPAFQLQRTDIAPAARPPALLPLYGTLAALQVADAVLTIRGIDAGARELNPLMRHGAAMTATKAATAVTTVLIVEKMWKRNKAAAIAALIAANAATGLIVARNARIVSSLQR